MEPLGPRTATRINIDGDGGVTVGSANTNSIVLDTDAGGEVTVDGNVTIGQTDFNGNQDAIHQYVGVPNMAGFVLSTMSDGSETVNTDFGDNEDPAAADWVATANNAVATNTAWYRKDNGGTPASLRYTVDAAVADGNGADCALTTGNQDWTDDDYFGMWMNCNLALADGDELVLEITDTVAGATEIAFEAYPTALAWQWVKADFSATANASKDVISTIAIDFTAAGVTDVNGNGGAVCYFDYMWKWDAAEEETMTLDVLEDGVIAVWATDDDAGDGNIPVLLTEGTDFFVNYETGNDDIVAITDQSENAGWGMAALE